MTEAICVTKLCCQHANVRQHTSAYVSIRQNTSAYVSIRQHTLAHFSIALIVLFCHNSAANTPTMRSVSVCSKILIRTTHLVFARVGKCLVLQMPCVCVCVCVCVYQCVSSPLFPCALYAANKSSTNPPSQDRPHL